jgi:hypothetical protein
MTDSIDELRSLGNRAIQSAHNRGVNVGLSFGVVVGFLAGCLFMWGLQ